MKTFLLLIAVCTFFPLPGPAAGTDCAKSSDACRPQPVKVTPFMAELKQVTRATELKQRTANESDAHNGERAAAPTSSAPAPISPAAGGPQVKKETVSRPGWLVAAALFLCGLYYFLKEGKKRKGKR